MRSMLPQSRKTTVAVGDVGGRLVEDLLERQEAVLDRQRELLRGEEHHRVLAELARAGGASPSSEPSASPSGPSWVVSRKRSPRAELRRDLLEVGGHQPRRPRSSIRRRAAARSACPARSCRRSGRSGSGCASSASRARSAPGSRRARSAARPASPRAPSSEPSTLTKTRAVRRSGLVSTDVTVTNPIRGSLRSVADRRPDDLAQHLVDAPHAGGGHRGATIQPRSTTVTRSRAAGSDASRGCPRG